MQFSSIEFLFYFLPAFLVVYYIFPEKWRNAALLAGSVIFYGVGIQWDFVSLYVLILVTICTYFAGRVLQVRAYRWIFWPVVLVLLGVLVFLKCVDGGSMLPVGMSFYLFQITAYLVSVYSGSLQAEKNVLRYSASVWMFPKLLSGPLAEPADLLEQLRKRRCSQEQFHNGLQLLICGMAMKVILANRIGGLWSQADVVGYESISPAFAWLSLVGYAMKLYFDFFGYSLMAVGIGRMLGFRLPHNFLDPYWSTSVSEFYRRWHITLGAWFRRNLYIPLGGNRKGMARTLLNLAVVWTFTGLWHGVGGNYLLWAGILLACVILERLWLKEALKKLPILGHIYTVFAILLSWVPFAIGDWGKMGTFFGRLFGLCGSTVNGLDFVYWAGKYALLLIVGVVLMTPLPRKLWKRGENTVFSDVLCFVLFWISVYFIATAAQDPFMYGQY